MEKKDRDHNLDPERTEGDVPARVEASFVNLRTLIIAGIGLVAMFVFVYLAAAALLIPFFGIGEESGVPEVDQSPPQPRLQPYPQADLEALQATQQANLEGYAWIDQSRGIVRIPIERAMELIGGQGVPAGGEQPETTGIPGTPEGTAGSVELGQSIFQEQGCSGCHSDQNTSAAPTLNGVAGSQVTLDSGQTVTADDAYLRQSIIDPHSQLVQGYGPVMPDTYGDRLSEEQIAALVEYIKSLGSP